MIRAGTFKAAWNVYVSQSLDGGQNFGQERVGGLPVQSRPREVPDPLAHLR